MLYKITATKRFHKSFKKLKKSGVFDLVEFEEIINLIALGVPLPQQRKDHALNGEWLGYRECHICPDLLLIYLIEENELKLADIGSHSELFG